MNEIGSCVTARVIRTVLIEAQRRTHPVACVVTAQGVGRIIYSVFNRLNLEGRQHTLRRFTHTPFGIISVRLFLDFTHPIT